MGTDVAYQLKRASKLFELLSQITTWSVVIFAEEEGAKGQQASTVVLTSHESTVTTTTANADEVNEPSD